MAGSSGPDRGPWHFRIQVARIPQEICHLQSSIRLGYTSISQAFPRQGTAMSSRVRVLRAEGEGAPPAKAYTTLKFSCLRVSGEQDLIQDVALGSTGPFDVWNPVLGVCRCTIESSFSWLRPVIRSVYIRVHRGVAQPRPKRLIHLQSLTIMQCSSYAAGLKCTQASSRSPAWLVLRCMGRRCQKILSLKHNRRADANGNPKDALNMSLHGWHALLCALRRAQL